MRTNHNRFISLFLAFVMILSLVITAFAYDIPDGYTVDEFGRVISNDGTTAIGYMDDNGNIMWFEYSPYGAVGYLDANGNVVNGDTSHNVAPDVTVDVTPADNTNNYTDPDTAIAYEPTFVDEDLALVTKFKDVKTTAWYYNDVTECAKLGIVAGFEDGTFRPEDKVTDVQWVTMITRTFYNSDVETAAKSKPSGTPWYWANTKVASDKYLTNGVTINDKSMNRYDMAQVTCNTMSAHKKAPSFAERTAVQSSIKDYSNIPQNRQGAVKGCYAAGIIAGMSDGKFHGEQSMTRAQASAVIVRLLKLINNYNPGDKDNDQYDDGTSQDTGNNNQQTGSGKLANGKDATVANVQAILDQIQREYPTGTSWGTSSTPGTNYYADGPVSGYDSTRDVSKAVSKFGSTSHRYACGGWMCMVSERIFGKTGAPAREITDITKARPGDIVVCMNAERNGISHVGIFLQYVPANTPCPSGSTYSVPAFITCDGNLGSKTGGTVTWNHVNPMWNGFSELGTAYHILTRYPENESEIESEIP